MSDDNVTPRIAGKHMNSHVGRHVLLMVECLDTGGDVCTVKCCDGKVIRVSTQPGDRFQRYVGIVLFIVIVIVIVILFSFVSLYVLYVYVFILHQYIYSKYAQIMAKVNHPQSGGVEAEVLSIEEVSDTFDMENYDKLSDLMNGQYKSLFV